MNPSSGGAKIGQHNINRRNWVNPSVLYELSLYTELKEQPTRRFSTSEALIYVAAWAICCAGWSIDYPPIGTWPFSRVIPFALFMTPFGLIVAPIGFAIGGRRYFLPGFVVGAVIGFLLVIILLAMTPLAR